MTSRMDDRARAAFARRARESERIELHAGSATEHLRVQPPKTAVGVLDRTVAILAAVEDGARTFTDIVDATGFTRSTVHRLIRALEAHGLLLNVGSDSVGYALGPRLLSLAASATRELPLKELAHPALERLSRTTGESAQLFVLDGDARLCVDVVESERELRTIVGVGASLPLTKGSAGKVLLAFGPPDLRERLGPTTDSPDRLATQLLTTRRRGWADSVGEREAGVASVSAPVRGPGGAVVAAVSVSGPAQRLGRNRATTYAPPVLDAAREIERALGTERVPVTEPPYQA